MVFFFYIFPLKSFMHFFSLPTQSTCPARFILLHLIAEQYMMSSTDYEAPHYVVFSTLLSFPPLRSRNLLSTLFSNTLSPCSSLIVRDQVSHTYTTTVRIIVLCILTSSFLDSKWEDKGFWNER